jgi:hypothetical protein
VATKLIERIERAAGIPGLVEILADRLSPTDLSSLLLEVHRRRVGRIAPAKVLGQYESNRFVRPSGIDPAALADFDRLAFESLGSLGYEAVELSPVSPLGTVAAVATVDQNNVLTTSRTTEVVADATNSLALECAVRRRALLRSSPRDISRVRLCASHRLVRGQLFDGPARWPHFRLLALTTAGRDEGSFRFETTSLREELGALLGLLARARDAGPALSDVRLTITELADGMRKPVLQEQVLAPLAERFPDVAVAFDDEREGGRGYYVGACFHIHGTLPDGRRLQLGDGGFTTWTAQLLGNAKERLLIASLGIERLCAPSDAGEPAS